jgi:hypothetical protein
MSLPNCSTLITGAQAANCLGIKKPGGTMASIYVGLRSDLATLTIGTDGEITAMTMKASKYLYKFTSQNHLHDLKSSVVPKPTGKNMFKHGGVFTFFPYTPSEFASLEALLKSERMFAIIPTIAGQIKTLGLDVNPYVSDIDDERGLMVTGGDITEGVKYEDRGSVTVHLEGEFFDLPKQYKPATSFATNITALDALVGS